MNEERIPFSTVNGSRLSLTSQQWKSLKPSDVIYSGSRHIDRWNSIRQNKYIHSITNAVSRILSVKMCQLSPSGEIITIYSRDKINKCSNIPQTAYKSAEFEKSILFFDNLTSDNVRFQIKQYTRRYYKSPAKENTYIVMF